MIKKSKKIFSIFMTAITLVCCLSVFTACKKKGDGDDANASAPVAITESMISLEYSSVEYSRTEKCPTVVLKNGETTIESSEYSVTYSNNVNIGTAKVTVSAVEGSTVVSGSADKTFEIVNAELPEIQAMGYELYDGEEKVPNVIISGLLTTDYDISWEYKSLTDEDSEYQTLNKQENHFILTGHYRLTAVGKGNYHGTRTAIYSIYNAFGNISLSESSFNYDASQHLPEISITGLIKDVDYELSFAYKAVGETEFSEYQIVADKQDTQFVDAGEYKVIATGLGIYGGVREATFTINALQIPDISMSSGTTYDGTSKTPNYTVGSLVEDINYTVKWEYRVFNGEYSEYTLSYNGNNFVNSGEYRITVTGKGNYVGEKTAVYTITRTDISATVSKNSYTYNGDHGKVNIMFNIQLSVYPSYKYYYAQGTFANVADTDTWAEYSIDLNLNAGTYSLYAVTEAFGNYNATTTPIIQFEVAKDELKGLPNLSGMTYTYDGASHDPNIVISSKLKTSGLVEDEDYKLEWKIIKGGTETAYVPDKDHTENNFVDAGYYKVTLRAYGNYVISDTSNILKETYFVINKAEYDTFTVSRTGYIYGETPTDFVLKGVKGTNGVETLEATITYQVQLADTTDWVTITKDTVLDAGRYLIRATASGKANYNDKTTAVTDSTIFVVAKGNLIKDNTNSANNDYKLENGSTDTGLNLSVSSSSEGLNALLESATIKYYYYLSGSTESPTELTDSTILEAGTYQIYAVISNLKNYNDYTTATITYTVADKNA